MQEALIHFAAPTLGGIKSGNIFTFKGNNIDEQIEENNKMFNPMGVYIESLACNSNGALIYVYRPKFLERDFSDGRVTEFMSQYGYNTEDSKKAVESLKERIRQLEDFPHEIGLFLSYPIEDVLGFIENRGKNYILNGYWKVYGNEEEARKSFFKYRKCTDVYHKLFMGGTPIEKLVRAAAY